MAKHCVNGTLDDSNYSSPMPEIGLYIAGGTLVCLIFMFCDIYAGLRKGRRWLPCRLFSLNSLTLTLLAVAAKLPVDLTSPMPRAIDQLSKLTGTTLICVCMAFFMPSIAAMSSAERFTNVASLSVFVITVIVNVCIQMQTGVIHSLIVEHITVLVCMFLLLVLLWCISLEASIHDFDTPNHSREIFEKGSGSMMLRLKSCYVSSRSNNLEFAVSNTPYSSSVGMFSTLCTGILTEAVLQSLVLWPVKSCKGESDYKWSMWIVVVSQIIIVMLGCFGNLFRWITLPRQMWRWQFLFDLRTDTLYLDFKQGPKILLRRLTKCIFLPVRFINGWVSLTSFCFVIPFVWVKEHIVWVKEHIPISLHKRYDNVGAVQEILAQIPYLDDECIARICLKDIERWIATNKRKPLTHLINLLSEKPPSSPESFSHYNNLLSQPRSFSESVSNFDYRSQFCNHKLSCLSVLALVREAENHLLPEFKESLVRSLDEVFQTICFIDGQTGEVNKEKLKWAQILWKNGVLNIDKDEVLKRSILNAAREFEFVRLIRRQGGNYIQVFVDMLHYFLRKLPHAIFKDCLESSAEELEERAKHAIQVLIKLESLENKIQWEFPEELHCSSLITPLSANDDHITMHRESNEPPLPAQPIKDQSNEFGDVISEIQQIV